MRVKFPGWPRTHPLGLAERQLQALLDQQFSRLQPLQLCFDLLQRFQLPHPEPPRRQLQPGQRQVFSGPRQRGQQIFLARFQQRLLGDGARRNNPHDFAFHQALARNGVAHLFADGGRDPLANQPRQVVVERMVGHARHRYRRPAGFPAGGEGDVQQLGGAARIVEKHFVKIPHAKQQQGVGKLRLDAEVLLHQGGVRARLALRFTILL